MPGGFDLAFPLRALHTASIRRTTPPAATRPGRCIEAAVRLAGTTDHAAVRDELAVLKFRSILGNYRVDATGLQTAKSTYLVQWQDDHISLVYPPDVARWKLLYPYPG